MNRTVFGDIWVGGFLVKPCINASIVLLFFKDKQIHHITEFNFLFRPTNS